jgi:tRNA A37 threonylcarbamoyladenosine modification protein TsaB
MKLSIDSSSFKTVKVCIDDKCDVAPLRTRSSQALLPFISNFLKEEKYSFSDISEIVVSTSGESYTGLRVGMTVAQTLGWLLSVPVNGLSPSKGIIPLTYNTDKKEQ